MRTIVQNERGISIVGSVFAFIILGVMGAALVSLVSVDQDTRVRLIDRTRSFYAVQAGFEYALHEINEGGAPIVEGKALDTSAAFAVTIKSGNHEIVVTGIANDARRTHTITADLLGGDCLEVDTSGATVGGAGNGQLLGVVLRQTCLDAVTIEEMNVSLTPSSGETVRRISIGGNTVYNDIVGVLGDIDIDDALIQGDVAIDFIEFSSSLVGKTVSLQLTCTDSSAVTASPMTL